MKPNLSKAIVILGLSILCPTVVNAVQQVSTTHTQQGDEKKIILIKKGSSGDRNHCPAVPVYGNYDGSFLQIDFIGLDPNQSAIICINGIDIYPTSIDELIHGVGIDITTNDSIEIILSDGTIYCESN